MTFKLSRILPGRRAYDDAKQGLQDAQRELARVRGQWPVVRALSAVANEHGRRNGFSESIAHVYRGAR